MMRMKSLISLLASLMAGLIPLSAFSGVEKNWVVYYGSALPAEDFLGYDLIVFDAQEHPFLRPLRNRGKTLLAYLSLGEVSKDDPYYETLKGYNIFLGENPNWPGRMIVDIRDPRWLKHLLEVRIPNILFKRFDGIMLDTLDSPIEMARLRPKSLAGMNEAATTLIAHIRTHYPTLRIMMNRGFEILPNAAPHLDSVLIESLFADYTTQEGQSLEKSDYALNGEESSESILSLLRQTKKDHPHLAYFGLEYWNPEDKRGADTLYRLQREQGFVPYVSTPDLMQIHKGGDK